MANQEKVQAKRLIVLENERLNGISKKVNELGEWKFFKVLYGNSFFRILLLNLLLLVFIAPLVYFVLSYNSELSVWGVTLPFGNTLGVGYNPWLGVEDFSVGVTEELQASLFLKMIPCIAILSVAFSGAFACFRDSYWTGELKVFKPFFRGIGQTIGYSFPMFAMFGGIVYGIYRLQAVLSVLPGWLSVVITVLLSIVAAFFAIYCFIVLGVATVHKQSLGTNLKTSWYLLWNHLFLNVWYFVMMAVPLVLLVVVQGLLQAAYLAIFILFGMFAVTFIWMIHLMRIFAVYNPVPRKKVKQSEQGKEQAQNA